MRIRIPFFSRKPMPAAKFVVDLENLGKHILKGVELAAPIVAKISPAIPTIGPILTELATLVTNLENSGATLSPSEIESIITTVVASAQIKAATTVKT